jgi:hypothetical protein
MTVMTDHAAEAITRDTWCAGCDQLRPPLVMCWTADGLYRCHRCAKVRVMIDPDGKGPRLWADFSNV